MIEVAPAVALKVTDSGARSASAPTIVLVPGWGASSRVWDDQIRRLAPHARVIAFDPRSQGDSTIVPSGMTPEQRAMDLQVILQGLNVPRVHVVAWSAGVQDLAAYIGKFGTARLERIVFVDSVPSRGAAAVALAPERSGQLLSMVDLYAKAPRTYAEGMIGALFPRASAERRRDLVGDVLKTPPAIGAASMVGSFLGADRSSIGDRIDRPLLVIASSRSPDLSEQKGFVGTVGGARIEVMDTGHAVFEDQPDVFAKLILAFVNEESSP